MCLKPSEEIGSEVHRSVDQFFRIEKGKGKVVINGVENLFTNGVGIVVPVGSEHNVINVEILSNVVDEKFYISSSMSLCSHLLCQFSINKFLIFKYK